MTVCNRIVQQPSLFTNNNTYVNNYYNRVTTINNTFINKDNASLSIKNNITINNFNQPGKKQVLKTVQPYFGQKIGNFLSGYRAKQPKVGCGCKKQIGYANRFGRFYQPVLRFCSSIADKLRGFMTTRYSNV